MTYKPNKKKKYTEFNNQFHSYQNVEKPTLKYDQITDSQGLQRAHQQGDYYIPGRTMFIAGSHTARDWFDDVTKNTWLET